MKVKLRSISSIFSIGDKFLKHNKVSLISSKQLDKTSIIKILSTVTQVVPKRINTLNVKKFILSRNLSNRKKCKQYNPSIRLQYYKRIKRYKKIILTFEHSIHKSRFLNDFGIN